MQQNPSGHSVGMVGTHSLPLVDVPQTEWPVHPVLRKARVNILGDGLEWPQATFEQLPLLREIELVVDDGVLCARMPSPFNTDRLVDASLDEAADAQLPGHAPDRHRYYSRVTDNGFHVVGVFSAATVSGRRRYFQWLTGTWVEIGLSGFLYVRDDIDTHFSEITADQLEETQPGATTTSVPAGDESPFANSTARLDDSAVQSAAEPEIEHGEVPAASPTNAWPESGQPDAGWPLATEPDVGLVAAQPLAEIQQESPAQAPAEAPTGDGPIASIHEDAVRAVPDPSSGAASIAAVQHGIAVALATIAHRGGTDFAGAASIDHVARVAERFDPATDSIRHCAAWLHDVLDRSDFTDRDLLDAGVLPEIVEIVSILSSREGDIESREARIASNASARAVRLAALDDDDAAWRLRKLPIDARRDIRERHAAARRALGAA